MLWLISTAKLCVELASLAWAGQLVLGWLIGSRQHSNVIYQLFKTVALPVHRLADVMSPRWVLLKHRPWVALALICLIWSALTLSKIVFCVDAGMARCLA